MNFFNEHKDQSDNAYNRRLNQMMHLTLQSALGTLQTPHNEAKQCDNSCVNIHDFEDALSSVSAAS